MKVICAWCGKNLGEQFKEIGGVSHGVCDECLKNMRVKPNNDNNTKNKAVE